MREETKTDAATSQPDGGCAPALPPESRATEEGSRELQTTAPSSQRIEFADIELLRRAVQSARHHSRRGRHPRYVAVMSVFGLGSTYAAALCRRFGFDPDEEVRP